MQGYFTFILHTHLPYVLHHGKWPHGSDWLSEAAAECYLPLLAVLEDLDRRGVRVRLSMDFSPVILEQLADQAFIDVFSAYCDEKILAASKDRDYFTRNGEGHQIPMADFWHGFYSDAKQRFLENYGGNLVEGFRRLSEKKILDAMTCGATHGYFPLLLDDRNIRAQLRVAVETHERHFGSRPRGVWLPECAYRPAGYWKPQAGPIELRTDESKDRIGVDEFLGSLGLHYFVIDGHLIKGGQAVPTYHHFVDEPWIDLPSSDPFFKEGSPEASERSLAELYRVGRKGEAIRDERANGSAPIVFARDAKTALQVWSSEHGYPGSAPYLEFHKKHHESGLRYWCVTGSHAGLGDKSPYDPHAVEASLESNATHFIALVKEQLELHQTEQKSPGIISAPFDSELFGHWWFEGPRFIGKVIEKLAAEDEVTITNCAEAVDNKLLLRSTISLPEGSWGKGGEHYVWMNKDVTWMWEKIYPLEARFLKTLDYVRDSYDSLSEDKLPPALALLLQQSGRELLLLEASDWEFLITTKAAADYAEERFRGHAQNLKSLLDITDDFLAGHGIDEQEASLLEEIALKDRLFPELSLEAWGQ